MSRVVDADEHIKKAVHRFRGDRNRILSVVVDRFLEVCQRDYDVALDDNFCEELAQALFETYMMGARHGINSTLPLGRQP